MSKRLGGIIGCKYKTSSGIETGSFIVVTLGQQYNVGEKPTVILYNYIDRHAVTACAWRCELLPDILLLTQALFLYGSMALSSYIIINIIIDSSCAWETSMDSSKTPNRCSWRRQRSWNHSASVMRGETAARQRAYPREMGAILPLAAERQIRHARSRHPEEAAAAPHPVTSVLGIEPKEEEISTAMKTMANAKAVGPDCLPAELLKLGLQQDRTILLELHRLTTLIWREGKGPQQWKDTVITVLHY